MKRKNGKKKRQNGIPSPPRLGGKATKALITLCEGCGYEARADTLTDGYCPTCANYCLRPDYTKASAYRGDTYGKKIARFALYATVAQAMDRRVVGGVAILLAGDEAAELGCMYALLGRHIPVSRIILVDRDIRGLKKAEEKHPGIRTYCGELSALLKTIDTISYIHLDLCGQFTDKYEELLRQIGKKLVKGSIVAHTFMRGREQKKQQWWKDSVQYGRSFYGRILSQHIGIASAELRKREMAKVTDETYARVFGFPYRGAKALHRKGLAGMLPIRKIRYTSTTPFTILVWRVGIGLPSTIQQATVLSAIDLDTIWIKGSKKEYMEHVLGMRLSGIDAKTVAKMLTLSPGTIHAWHAHYTRGTYPKLKPFTKGFRQHD